LTRKIWPEKTKKQIWKQNKNYYIS